MHDQIIELSALYRAPVTVCAEHGSGRYRASVADRGRLVLEVDPGAGPARTEIGELVTIGCPDPDGWVTGEVRVVALRPNGALVTTAPRLSITQRREAHRVPLALDVAVAEVDDDELGWTAGRTSDLSADGFSALLSPATVMAGDRLRVQLALPDGQVVEGEVETVVGAPILRACWSSLAERDRDRIVRAINQTQVHRRR